MTPDQRETHCGDSGVKLDGKPSTWPAFNEADPLGGDTWTAVICDGEVHRLDGARKSPTFPEAATDPWEEQG